LSPLAVKKKIKLAADISVNVKARGNRNALAIMLRNLIDNAIKFTPEGGEIRVLLFLDRHSAVLKVYDSGPGIEDAEKDKVFGRFYRAQKNKQGSGLGLSMAKWVCDVHEADIVLS